MVSFGAVPVQMHTHISTRRLVWQSSISHNRKNSISRQSLNKRQNSIMNTEEKYTYEIA